VKPLIEAIKSYTLIQQSEKRDALKDISIVA
jgi:hypothetical protein